MQGLSVPTTTRIVLELNDLELAQLRRIVETVPAAVNAQLIVKMLNALPIED